MRATISIPDALFSEAKELAGERSFSEFASEAIQERVLRLQRGRLAREMEEGYRAEASSPSMDPAWAGFEVEGLCEIRLALERHLWF
jgi:predicted CopG family antitoxin